MSKKSKNILIAVIGYAITVCITIIAIVLLNNYKDVPVASQHIFGHDLDSYKVFSYWTMVVVDVILIAATSFIAFYDGKKNDEEK